MTIVATSLTLSGWWCSRCQAAADTRPACGCPNVGHERRVVTRGTTVVQLDELRPNRVVHDRWRLAPPPFINATPNRP